MKSRLGGLILIPAIIAFSWHLQANPFSCKLNKQKTSRPDKHQTTLSFIGYASMENQRFAIVQVKKNQYILKKGESVEDIKIIRFTSESLVYKENDTIFSIPINPNKP